MLGNAKSAKNALPNMAGEATSSSGLTVPRFNYKSGLFAEVALPLPEPAFAPMTGAAPTPVAWSSTAAAWLPFRQQRPSDQGEDAKDDQRIHIQPFCEMIREIL